MDKEVASAGEWDPDNRIEAEMASKAFKELKKTLRSHVDGIVQQLSQNEVNIQSEAITQHILVAPAFKRAKNVGIYASFPEHEASTVDLARQIFKLGRSASHSVDLFWLIGVVLRR